MKNLISDGGTYWIFSKNKPKQVELSGKPDLLGFEVSGGGVFIIVANKLDSIEEVLSMNKDKPSWSSAPKWAQYLILDESGAWAFCEHEPDRIGLSVSNELFAWVIKTGRSKYVTKPTGSWHKLHIEKRPN